MIVPCLELKAGSIVTWRDGHHVPVPGLEPISQAGRLALAGIVTVIDLDAAMGSGSNQQLVEAIVAAVPCRVGGGIRTAAQARRWLELGARKMIIGSAASESLFGALPGERVAMALDVRGDSLFADGWCRQLPETIHARVQRLGAYVSEIVVSLGNIEGTGAGFDEDRAAELLSMAGAARLTIGGGIATAVDIARADAMGIDVQVSSALHLGNLDLADAIVAPLLVSDPQGPWPTVVTDEEGRALGLAYSNPQSVRLAVSTRTGTYLSRKRGIWRKGETSGNVQELRAVRLDCDRDTLLFEVHQQGSGFCHAGTRDCWASARGLAALPERLQRSVESGDIGSLTRKLLRDPACLRSKLREETGELCSASDRADVIWEAADVLYFLSVLLRERGVDFSAVDAELEARHWRGVRKGKEC